MNHDVAPVPEFPGYQVSRCGDVWSDKSGKFLKLLPDKRGYRYVALRKSGRTIRRPVHQLVLEAHVGPRPEDFQLVRHLNGVTHDNRLENLRYGTFKENVADTIRHGSHRRTGAPKLGVNQLYEIRELLRQGVFQKEIARRYGVGKSTINRISTGKTYTSMDIKDFQ